MTVGGFGTVNGFTTVEVEIAGRIVGQKDGYWRFHDGVKPRWLPKAVCRWRTLRGGYVLMTVPEWLFRRPSLQPKQPLKYQRWTSSRGRPRRWKGFT